MTQSNFMQTVCACGRPIDLQTAKKNKDGVFTCEICLNDKAVSYSKIPRERLEAQYREAVSITIADKEREIAELKAQLEGCKEENYRHIKGEFDALQKAEQLRELVGRLVEKLEIVDNDPQYRSVWTLYLAHGGRYKGPTYQEELDAVRLELAASLKDSREAKEPKA